MSFEMKRKWHKITNNTSERWLYILFKVNRPRGGSGQMNNTEAYQIHKNLRTDDLCNIHLKIVAYITNLQRETFLNSLQVSCNVFENLFLIKVI